MGSRRWQLAFAFVAALPAAAVAETGTQPTPCC